MKRLLENNSNIKAIIPALIYDNIYQGLPFVGKNTDLVEKGINHPLFYFRFDLSDFAGYIFDYPAGCNNTVITHLGHPSDLHFNFRSKFKFDNDSYPWMMFYLFMG